MVTAVAAVLLTAIGIGAIVKGIDGRSTVRDKLGLEQVVGIPTFTPKTIAGLADKAGLKGVERRRARRPARRSPTVPAHAASRSTCASTR